MPNSIMALNPREKHDFFTAQQFATPPLRLLTALLLGGRAPHISHAEVVHLKEIFQNHVTAPIVWPEGAPRPLPGDSAFDRELTPFYTQMEFTQTISMLKKALSQEPPEGWTWQQRSDYLVLQWIGTAKRAVGERGEQLLAEYLTYGTMTFESENAPNVVLNWGMDSRLFPSLAGQADAWGTGNETPLQDIAYSAKEFRKISKGMVPTLLLGTTEVIELALRDQSFQDAINNNLNNGKSWISAGINVSDQMAHMGHLTGPTTLDLYAFDGTTVDSTGVERSALDPDCLYFLNPEASDGFMWTGGVENFNALDQDPNGNIGGESLDDAAMTDMVPLFMQDIRDPNGKFIKTTAEARALPIPSTRRNGHLCLRVR